MKKIFLFLTILSFMWAQDDVIIYDYVPLEDVNLSSLDPVQSLKTLPHQRNKFQKVVQGNGTGESKEEALNNALIDALSQFKGVSNVNLRQELQSIDLSFSYLGQISQKSKSVLQNVSKGYIDTYKVDKIDQNGTLWQVEISAFKSLYQNDNKPKLVILNDKNKEESYLKRALYDAFSQDENFTLLEREHDFKDENKIIKSEDGSSEESYKLGNVLGADYILEFEILDITQVKQSKISYQNNTKASINIAYKLIFYPTRELVFSKTFNTTFTLSGDSKKEQKNWENIALFMQREMEKSLFFDTLEEDNKQEGKENTYKLHENGGVNLGF
ncbi:hypothetical protein DY886_04470 [Campylobacter coli]|nr:hypothetical protein [Campylobacter coli]